MPTASRGSTTLFFCLLITSMLLGGCTSTPITAVSDFNASYDFNGVKKLLILPIDRTSAAEKLISDMQVERIDEALAKELGERGYQLVEDREEADLYVSWHLVTREKTDIRSYNAVTAYTCWRCGPPVSDVSVRQYTEGTFIVDMIDPFMNQSVWRSTIQSQLRTDMDPTESASRRERAAKAALAAFPPDPAAS